VSEHVFVEGHDPNLKGNAAELGIAFEASRLGLTVLKPLTEHERYDLVLGIGDRLMRAQCKWAERRGDVIKLRIRSSWHSPTRGYVLSTYSRNEIDVIAAFCPDPRSCYLLPIEQFEGQSMVHLRLGPARNGQRAALHFASQYELGAVAQLAERRGGTAKAGGSNPPSSTPRSDSHEAVGAHEFRNRFGWYMQRAAGGERFLVTRRGHAFVRLLPAQEPADQLSTAPIRLPMKRR
jgi:prevent-host-death family protein